VNDDYPREFGLQVAADNKKEIVVEGTQEMEKLVTNNNQRVGRHLMIDGVVKDPSVFSHEKLTELFVKLSKLLEMQIIQGPIFKDVEFDPTKLDSDVFQDEGGTTGYCLVSTSHMSIHTWALRGVFQMDIFSCKDYNAQKALNLVVDYLGVSQLKTHEVERIQLI
jgi:S-adenosylmethionine decarboxylase